MVAGSEVPELGRVSGDLLVRARGHWSRTPTGGVDPVPEPWAEVAASLDPAPASATLPPAVDEGTVLEPWPVVVADRRDRTLVVEATDGRPVVLHREAAALLEHLRGWCTAAELLDDVGALPDAPPRGVLAGHLALLVASGRVRVPRGAEPAPPPVAVPEAATPPGPAPRRGLLARLRGRAAGPVATMAAPDPSPADWPPAGPDTDAPAAPSVASADGPDDDEHTADPPTPRRAGRPEPDGRAPVPACPFDYLADPFPGGPAGPVPVYAVFPVDTGPVLALGMLTASARAHEGGALSRWYEIRRQEEPESFLADLAGRDGPAVVLLSNYVWSIGADLDLARRARALCPQAVIVHGGPSTPKYPGDVERFFADHEGLVDVTVRGEGEQTLVALLAALGPTFPEPDLRRLAGVAGLSYRDPDTGAVVRTEDRDRLADLDVLPSPYLTGEFDHLPIEAWNVPSGLLGLIFESNRGCPYGCTFCDWGSSTLSRIRKFSMERVDAEMRWAAERGLHAWTITDANFGIIARDVEIAERMGALAKELGHPRHFGFNVAKNTTKHLTAILDRLVEAGVVAHFSLAMQTRDEATLTAVERTNISVDHYLALAAAFRRRRLPLDADVMVGLPGQTLDSFAGDLQFCIDHEIPARMWITELLPNAPMNDPAYRERWAIEADEHRVVVATATFTRDERRLMMRLRHAYTAFERFGILRLVLRYAQWDHGVPAMDVVRRILTLSETDPGRYPLLDWVSRHFDHFNAPPLGWRAFFDEVGDFLEHELGIGPSPDREAVLAAQAFVLPDVGRSFPDTRALDHDVVGWFRDHTRALWGDGVAEPLRPLSTYPATELTVYGDPLDSCGRGITATDDPRNEVLTERFWIVGHWELDSPLVSNVPEVAAAAPQFRGLPEGVPADLRPEAEIEGPGRTATPVTLSRVGAGPSA